MGQTVLQESKPPFIAGLSKELEGVPQSEHGQQFRHGGIRIAPSPTLTFNSTTTTTTTTNLTPTTSSIITGVTAATTTITITNTVTNYRQHENVGWYNW